MQDTLNPNATSTSLRRRPGLAGGVVAGISRSIGIAALPLRLIAVGSAFLFGPVALLSYMVAWMLIPVDESLPASQRPSSIPKAIVGVVAVIVAVRMAFGLLTSLASSWLVIAAVAAAVYWLFIRD